MKILITAGPTRQPIDSVRYISNRSSGRMGIALAKAGIEQGHEVTLLLGAVCIKAPEGCVIYRFETNNDLQNLLKTHAPKCDILIMSAAVSDYKIAQTKKGKIKRLDNKNLTLHLEPTNDLVANIAKNKKKHQKIIAFALENAKDKNELKQLAQKKLKRKNVDAIIANPIDTMDAIDTAGFVLTKSGKCLESNIKNNTSPKNLNDQIKVSKDDFANWLIEKCADI